MNRRGRLIPWLWLLPSLLFIAVFPSLTSYRDVFAFLVLLFVLVYKPTGLLGARIREQKM